MEINRRIFLLNTTVATAAAASAGANGWTDLFVSTETIEAEQQRNKRKFMISEFFTKYELNAYQSNPLRFDATNILKRALNSIDILDCDNLPLSISSTLTVRKNCQFLNINITNLKVMESSILVNSNAKVTGVITGSGAGGDTIERGIYAATESVADVYLDLKISNLTVGVQVSNQEPLTNSCSHWSGTLKFENLTGGGINSNGYGLLMPHATHCLFTVYADNVPRHDVYLSAGATDNKILCYSNNSKGSPLSIASYSTQDYNTRNNVTIRVENCTPQSSSSKYAAVVTGKSRNNNIYIYGKNSPLLDGALVFRSLATNAVCHDNYAYINWSGGSSSNLIVNEASFNNEFDIVGFGGIVGSSTGALISTNEYNGIKTFNDGIPKFSARIKSLIWDASKTEVGHSPYSYAVIQGLSAASFDVGDGVLKGAKGFAFGKVGLYAANVIGSTH